MRIGRIGRRTPQPARPSSEPVIVFTVASHTLAIAAQAVEEIRDMAGVELVNAVAGCSKVRQVFRREEKTYYVVDANVHLELLDSHPARLLLLRNQRIALSVDGIEGMAEVANLHPLPRVFQGAERQWYRGLAVIGNRVVPVMNPEALITVGEMEVLRAGTNLAKAAMVSA